MTTLVVGTNSYVDLTIANAYFADNIRNDDWSGLDDDVKAKACVTATRMLDRQAWSGDKTVSSQALQWPRTGVTDKYGNAVDSTTVPQQIKDAECELALLLTQDSTVETNKNTNNNVKFLRAGTAEVAYFRAVAGGRFPTIIQELIGQFLGSATQLTAPFASGTCETSKFTDCNDYGLTEGI